MEKPLDRKNKAVKQWVSTLEVMATSEQDALILLSYHASKGPGVDPVEFSTWDDFVKWCDKVLGGAGWTYQAKPPALAYHGKRSSLAWTYSLYRAEDTNHGDDQGVQWVGAWGVNALDSGGYNF